MRTSHRAARALRPALLALLALGLSGCLVRPRPTRTHPATPAQAHRSARLGRPYRVVPERSRLIILVYRAGPLAALGHNHVIACRCVSGTFYVPHRVQDTTFTLSIRVRRFTVDDPRLRAAQHSAAFPPDVPQSARRRTRHNMLSAAVLDAQAFPDIDIRSAGLQRAPARRGAEVQARVQIGLRGRTHLLTLPVHYTLSRGELAARGVFSLQQTSLGLKPFSVLLGALRVKNQLTVRFHLVAVPASPARAAQPPVTPRSSAAARRPAR